MDYQYSCVGNPWSAKVTMSQRESSGNTRCFQFYKGEWEKLSIFKGREVTYFQTHFNIQCHSWNLCLRKLATVTACYFLEWFTCDITYFYYEVQLYILNFFHLWCKVCGEVLSQHFKLMECFHRHKHLRWNCFVASIVESVYWLGYTLDIPEFESRQWLGSFLQNVQTVRGVHPAYY